MGDNYIINGWIIGGCKHNNYGDDREGRCAEQKPSKKVEIDQRKQTSFLKWLEMKLVKQKPSKNKGHSQDETFEEHPPGALSFAYSFIPYQQYQYPPPPPYQYGGYGGPPPQMAGAGHGYYGGYHGPGGYDYWMNHTYTNMVGSLPEHGGAAATGAPVHGHGQHHTISKQLVQDRLPRPA